AVLIKTGEANDEEKLYFVVETKGSIFEEERREVENLKIKCGKKHFETVSEDVKFEVTNNFEHFSRKF
ncbi:restriction endonuclease, partial [Fusobacterium mortiferum]|uniref:restriction endonuclease n=2 Tax=Fusobacterium TaxID=848 RepID=UPI00195B9F2B|nr:hypothetical protein [Fusobacterium mortiferum]